MKIANVVVRKSNKKPNWAGLCAWLKDRRPDVVTLQKIGSDFPKKGKFFELGYESQFLTGSHWYLGVAVLARQELPQPKVRACRLAGAEQDGPRFLTVEIGGLRISSLYAPYGPPKSKLGDERPKHERAIERRVAWLNRLRDNIAAEGYCREKSLLCGDFNVKFKTDGRRENDCFYSQNEEDALQELTDLGFCDLYRKMHPNEKGRTRGYDENPEGTARLHLILASESLAQGCRRVWLDCNRDLWPRPDAPPLIADLDVEV